MSSWSADLSLLQTQLDRVADLDREATDGPWGLEYEHQSWEEGGESFLAGVWLPDRDSPDGNRFIELEYLPDEYHSFAVEARTLLPQLARALRSVLEHHPRKTAMDGNLDYCPRCLEHEGALWPCETVRGLLTAWKETS